MGEAFSSVSSHGSADYLSGEPWIELEEARALSSNPASVTSRYHRGEVSGLADVYERTGTVLGQGMSGEVMLAMGRHDGQKYALKVLNKRNAKANGLKTLKREVEIHLSVDHPGIARLCDVYECPEQITLVMECCTGGELFERLLEQESSSLPEPEAADTAAQMLRAVGYLHAHGIAHRDLKLENFLYESEEPRAPLKLIDFGLARVWKWGDAPMRACCGSIAYVSPDVLGNAGYTSKCDMWSLGVISFMLLTGQAPFTGSTGAIKAHIKAGKIDYDEESWQGVSSEARDFVQSLLAFDPEQRPDATTALVHPWLLRMGSRAPAAPTLTTPVLLSMQRYACAPKLRQLVLQLVARELPPEEARELLDIFLGLDAEKTGTVSLQELTDACRRHRAARAGDSVWSRFSLWPSASAALPRVAGRLLPSSRRTAESDAGQLQAEELFSALDCNGDGECYASDFVAAALASLPRPQELALRRAFARLDADGSGALSASDLQSTLGGALEAAEELLSSSGLTLDERGELGFEAFAHMLKGGGGGPGSLVMARM